MDRGVALEEANTGVHYYLIIFFIYLKSVLLRALGLDT